MSVIEVQPVTPERWNDVADLFERTGPRGGTPQTDGCWCRFWHARGNAYWDGLGAGHRAKLEEEIASGAARALLAYEDEVAVGWCRFGPRASFERLEHSPRLARVDEEDAWAVVCFYVHPAEKRKGIASALLAAAVEHAFAQGAAVVEGYPVRVGHMNIDAYTGYLPMFLEAGFEPVRDAGRRVFVRRTIKPSRRGSTR